MPLTGSMQVLSVSVPVSDQEQAREFYVDTLGFELLVDNSGREGMRWIEVAPEGSVISLMLVSWSDPLIPSLYRVIAVATDDIQTIHEELVAKGVSFDLLPTELSYGVQAMFRDPDGNAVVLLERSSFASRGSARHSSGRARPDIVLQVQNHLVCSSVLYWQAAKGRWRVREVNWTSSPLLIKGIRRT